MAENRTRWGIFIRRGRRLGGTLLSSVGVLSASSLAIYKNNPPPGDAGVPGRYDV